MPHTGNTTNTLALVTERDCFHPHFLPNNLQFHVFMLCFSHYTNTYLTPLSVNFPTSDVDESVPRDGALFAVEVEVEQSTLPVTVIKLIADVPAQRTELLPFL